MNFKKKSIIKKDTNVLNIIWIVSIWVIFIIALIFIKNVNFIQIKIDEQQILRASEEKEEKERSMLEKVLWIKKTSTTQEENENDLTILLVWRW